MTPQHTDTAPAKWLEFTALGLIYFIWGSTYLGISVAIETMPPLIMAGTRFVIAGLMLLAWKWPRHGARPTAIHWRSALIVGSLMLLGGNGGVTVAEEYGVPTGFVALMIGAVPIWITVLNWLFFGAPRPNGRMALGLAAGLSGLVLLLGPSTLVSGEEAVDPTGVLLLIMAALTWATGSLYSRKGALPDAPLLATGMEMFMGGVALFAVATVRGEWGDLDLALISGKSLIALVYLTLIGSLVAFTAYTWLLRNTTPTRAASYGYVNPVVAMLLGWFVLDEVITLRMIVAAAIIIGSVRVITSLRAQQTAAAAPADHLTESHSPSVSESYASK